MRPVTEDPVAVGPRLVASWPASGTLASRAIPSGRASGSALAGTAMPESSANQPSTQTSHIMARVIASSGSAA